MEQQTNYIVYLCYGDHGILQECAYSLLSLSRLYTPAELVNIQVWIYTDNPGFFQSFKECTLPLHYRKLDEATIKAWRGKIDFAHRAKIEALRELTKDRTGNIFYVDSDSVFIGKPDAMLQQIQQGQLYMHVAEGVVSNRSNPILSKLDDYLKKNSTLTINGKPIIEAVMWNAGVIGFNTDKKYLLDEALAYTDNVYPQFSKHIVEQFAVSVYFQKAGVVKAAAPYIIHYWNLKEAKIVLASFFEYFKDSNWTELTKYSNLLQMHVMLQEKMSYLGNRTFIQRLQNKKWMPAKQDWAELSRQL